MMGED